MYANLKDPVVQEIFRVSAILSLLRDAEVRMSTTRLQKRQDLYYACKPILEDLRQSNREFFENEEEITAQIQKLDEEHARLVDLARPPEIALALEKIDLPKAVRLREPCPVCGGRLQFVRIDPWPKRVMCTICFEPVSGENSVLNHLFGCNFI